MKTSVERIDDTTVKLSVTVEADRVREAVDAAARRLAEDVRIPGFRPGRAPRRVLESRLGKGAVAQEAAREAVPAFYVEAAREAELAAIGQPELDVQTFEEGKDAEFSATVEVVPQIEPPDYEGLQIAHPEWELTDDELNAQLDALRERFAEVETVARPARVGDHVQITVTGSRHGEKVDAASGDDVLYEVGDAEESDSELDRQLVGAQAGAILKFNDTLGPDYADLAGEELAFTVIVKDVKAKRLPELDDDFAITASEFDTMEELREDLRTGLAAEKESYARAALRGRVVEAVAEPVEVPLPDALVQQELRFRLNQLGQEAEQQGMSLEQFLQAAGVSTEQVLSRFEEEARQTVKAQLVVDAIGRAAGIEVTQEDMTEEVYRQAQRLDRSPQELAQLMSHPDRIGALVSDVFRRKTIDHILEHVQVLSAPPDREPEEGDGNTTASVEADAGQQAASPDADADPEVGDDAHDRA